MIGNLNKNSIDFPKTDIYEARRIITLNIFITTLPFFYSNVLEYQERLIYLFVIHLVVVKNLETL